MAATKDQGLIEEATSIQADEKIQMQRSYDERMQARGLAPDISDLDYFNWWLREFNLPTESA